jgi:selenocysteine-specific elongation factor
LRVYEKAGLSSPSEDELLEELKVSPQVFENIMTALVDLRRLVRLSEKVIYHKKWLDQARELVIEHIKQHGSVTAAELRDKMGVTRKYTVAILEYLDTIQVTHRVGDKRILRQRQMEE